MLDPLQILHPFRRLRRLMRNIIFDLKIGGRFLGGSIPSKFEHLGAFVTSNTDYAALDWMFSKIKILDSDVFVDVGCGKGRALNWWISKYPLNKLIGVEIDPDVATKTRERLSSYKKVVVLTGNILECLPCEGTIFYLARPFNSKVLREFKALVEKIPASNGRPLIVYFNCMDKDVFENDPHWKMTCLDIPNDPFGQAVAFIQRASF